MTSKSRKEQIETMLLDEPNDPELHYMLAMEYASQGDDEGAVSCFQQTIERFPTYIPAYHQAGRTLQRLDRIAEARQLLIKGIPAAEAKGDMHAAGEMQELLANLE